MPAEHAQTVAAAGSPVRIGPETAARAALLTCAHYLPVGRARDLLETLTAIDVSTGFLAAIRGRAARQLEKKFGSLREDIRQRVNTADAEQLLDWSERLLDARSLNEVFGS